MSDNEMRDQNKKVVDKILQKVNEINKQIIECGWDGYYKNVRIEDIPWVDKELGFNLEEELNIMQLYKGIFPESCY